MRTDRGRSGPLFVCVLLGCKPFDRKRFADETSWVDANAIVLRRSACKLFSRLPRTKATFPKEDWEFVWRVSQDALVTHVPTPTVQYLVNPESFYTTWSPECTTSVDAPSGAE